jgi:glycosyltransferase involved in cell wall biosynthesis
MAKRKVLYVVHNHARVRPGGAEVYALELYQGMKASDEFEPIFLARTGPPTAPIDRYHEGTLVSQVGDDPNEYFLWTDVNDYDWFYGKNPVKTILTRYFKNFLVAQQPDVVHFQHSHFIGYDALYVTRKALPGVPIIYTLHEYLPICNNNGQMLRTMNDELCTEESTRRCHECFPEKSPSEFFYRKQFALSHFAEVDLFLAPSNYLLERYVDWGLPAEKIRFEDYGRLPVERVDPPKERRRRDRIAYFGQLSHFKGIDVLLKAMKLAGEERSRAHLNVFGANLDLQPQDFRDQVEDLLEQTEENVTFNGDYAQADLPKLIAETDWVVVPSLWAENSPLVIQEAFLHGRPVICSDIGGMAEKVVDGVSGLHFRKGSPMSLARAIQRAAGTPGLWDKLVEGIPPVYAMDDHVGSLTGIYRDLLDRAPVAA